MCRIWVARFHDFPSSFSLILSVLQHPMLFGSARSRMKSGIASNRCAASVALIRFCFERVVISLFSSLNKVVACYHFFRGTKLNSLAQWKEKSIRTRIPCAIVICQNGANYDWSIFLSDFCVNIIYRVPQRLEFIYLLLVSCALPSRPSSMTTHWDVRLRDASRKLIIQWTNLFGTYNLWLSMKYGKSSAAEAIRQKVVVAIGEIDSIQVIQIHSCCCWYRRLDTWE